MERLPSKMTLQSHPPFGDAFVVPADAHVGLLQAFCADVTLYRLDRNFGVGLGRTAADTVRAAANPRDLVVNSRPLPSMDFLLRMGDGITEKWYANKGLHRETGAITASTAHRLGAYVGYTTFSTAIEKTKRDAQDVILETIRSRALELMDDVAAYRWRDRRRVRSRAAQLLEDPAEVNRAGEKAFEDVEGKVAGFLPAVAASHFVDYLRIQGVSEADYAVSVHHLSDVARVVSEAAILRLLNSDSDAHDTPVIRHLSVPRGALTGYTAPEAFDRGVYSSMAFLVGIARAISARDCF